MSKILKSLFLLLIISFFSCQSPNYYQIYKTKPISRETNTDGNNPLVYEDENCKISYNFWNHGGNVSFEFQNKTDKTIHLNLDNSFFIKNGIAYDYGKNLKNITQRSIPKTDEDIKINEEDSKEGETEFSFLVQQDQTTVSIPSKTSKIFREYMIQDEVYRNCELIRFPSKKEVQTVYFNSENSPLIFSNRLAYQVDLEGEVIELENAFYVSEITNFPESEITEFRQDEFCGQSYGLKKRFFKEVLPEKFFLKYNKGTEASKH